MERLVMVLVALFTRMPPERVASPVAEKVEDKERVEKD
jgi:hypothetical protein